MWDAKTGSGLQPAVFSSLPRLEFNIDIKHIESVLSVQHSVATLFKDTAWFKQEAANILL